MMVHHDSFGFNAHENIISVYELHCSEVFFLLQYEKPNRGKSDNDHLEECHTFFLGCLLF